MIPDVSHRNAEYRELLLSGLRLYRGWITVTNGDLAKGILLLRNGLTAFRANGVDAWTPCYIAFLARACAIGGQVEEALALWDDALQIVERTQARWFAAELNRHKGRLLLQQGHPEAAEELYRKPLSIAREQEARLWELRSTTKFTGGWAATRVGAPRRATSWHPSTAGSPRA